MSGSSTAEVAPPLYEHLNLASERKQPSCYPRDANRQGQWRYQDCLSVGKTEMLPFPIKIQGRIIATNSNKKIALLR